MPDKSYIKKSIMSYNRRISAEINEFRKPLLIIALALYIIVSDGGELYDPRRYRTLRIYKMGEPVHNEAIFYLDCSYLYDETVLHGKACGLYVKYHEGV